MALDKEESLKLHRQASDAIWVHRKTIEAIIGVQDNCVAQGVPVSPKMQTVIDEQRTKMIEALGVIESNINFMQALLTESDEGLASSVKDMVD